MEGFFVSPDSYVIARWIFLRLLGLVYLIAFLSFAVQARGLIGERGILPAGKYLAQVKKVLGRRGYWSYPTLAWISTKDSFFLGICIAGMLLALALIAGLNTTPVLVLLWVGYLSLVVAAQIFLSYQWDVLLVETGFLAIFLVPPSLLPAQTSAPSSHWVIFLFAWLLFRLMFMSGLLKWISGDPTWHNLTAMSYHYETQPLPTPLAWWMHKAPVGFQKFSTAFALFAETLVPVLFLLPDPLRQIGAGMTILLQLLILLTGNFAFFNWLTIFLCVFLFHDSQLRAAVSPGLLSLISQPGAGVGPAWGRVVPVILTVFYVAIGLIFLVLRQIRASRFLGYIAPVIEVVQDWRLVNSYGLFVSMTTTHPEIILEGSDDGENWQPYEFKYKIGPLEKPLPLVAPHQPRLDWQTWFAALGGNYATENWFLHFVECLLEGSPAVLGLLARNPFPQHPPKYIRGLIYDYQFSTLAERRASGARWKRTLLGTYLPPASLHE